MIIPDINLLIYAYDSGSSFHAKASNWWQECLSGNEQVGLAPVVMFGFVRISTSARVFKHPMTPSEASKHVRSWLVQPVAQVLEPRSNHIEQVLDTLDALGTAGNLVTDAQIAALTIEHRATLHTNDTDFLRFSDLKWFNPMTGNSSSRVRRK
jgi:toxin-antitoxin system PIN domain toxin